MDKAKMLITANIQLSQKDLSFIQRIRQQYDPRGYDFIEPHFTLLSQHYFAESHINCREVKKALSSINKIEFILEKILLIPPSSEHTAWYVFLVPNKGRQQIINLHQIIRTNCIEVQPYSFIPHISVSRTQSRDSSLALINELNMLPLAIKGWINNIEFIEIKNGHKRTIDQLLLE